MQTLICAIAMMNIASSENGSKPSEKVLINKLNDSLMRYANRISYKEEGENFSEYRRKVQEILDKIQAYNSPTAFGTALGIIWSSKGGCGSKSHNFVMSYRSLVTDELSLNDKNFAKKVDSLRWSNPSKGACINAKIPLCHNELQIDTITRAKIFEIYHIRIPSASVNLGWEIINTKSGN